VHETFHVSPRDRGDLEAAEQGLDVAVDAPLVRHERALFLGLPAARQDAAGLRCLEIGIAQFDDRRGLALGTLSLSRVVSFHDFAKKSPRLVSRPIRRPGRAVAADRMPALPTVQSAVLEHIDNYLARPSANPVA
jgi:hypothetical protein